MTSKIELSGTYVAGMLRIWLIFYKSFHEPRWDVVVQKTHKRLAWDEAKRLY